MCRGKNVCSELGTNPAKFDKECPLRPPAWVDPCFNAFVDALDALIAGRRLECQDLLQSIQEKEKAFTDWYIEHGQISGNNRVRVLQAPPPVPVAAVRDTVRNASQALQNRILQRDHYHCRYCGCRLIDQEVLRTFVKKLASPLLTRGRKNMEKHGVILAAWPYIDHVVPHHLGGRTNAENLVSSCYSCNIGKDRYTCEQLGIANPFSRDPIDDGWNGLLPRLPFLKRL